MKHGLPSLLSIAVINVMTKKQVGEEGVYLAYASTWSWEVRAAQAEPVMTGAHWLVCQDLFSEPSQRTQAYLLGGSTTRRGWALPH